MQSAYSKEPTHTVEDRERLILEHLPQVRWIAANVHEKLPSGILQEDLVSAGIIGLIAAIDNFDPSRNTSLRTYAEYRIRGAILDSMRGLDGIPSHHRKRAKEVQAAIESAEQRLGRPASEEEIADELGMNLERISARPFSMSEVFHWARWTRSRTKIPESGCFDTWRTATN